MAFIHCHTCDWSQDDFYNKTGYNPAKSLSDWNEMLLGPNLDSLFSDDPEFMAANGSITQREVIAREYEKFAKNIRNMKWVTWESFKADPKKLCPKCGSDKLDCD